MPRDVRTGEPVSVSFDVTNTGSREGSDVVEVYVASPAAAGEPPKQLKGFAKTALQPSQTKRITVRLDPRWSSTWNTPVQQWIVVPGIYTVFVGESSRDLPLHADITVAAQTASVRQH